MKAVLLSTHHLTLTDAIKKLTTEKLAKLFHLDQRIQRARVELAEERDRTSATKLRFTARAILDGAGAVATAASEDLYKSIDLLVRKLDGQLRRKHGAVQVRRKYALQAA
jgi:putative sigma-54 modulation protein